MDVATTSWMDRLSNDILVRIFAELKAWELLRVLQVCTRWRDLIDEFVWKQTTTITERELGPHSPLPTRISNFVALVQKRPQIESYCFPFVGWIEKEVSDEKGRNVAAVGAASCRQLESGIHQLESVVTKLLSEGCIPVHLDAVTFLEKVRLCRQETASVDPRLWKELPCKAEALLASYSPKCRCVIVPFWSLEEPLVHCLTDQEIVVEKALLPSNPSSMPVVDEHARSVRIKELLFHDHVRHFEFTATLREDAASLQQLRSTLPTGDELDCHQLVLDLADSIECVSIGSERNPIDAEWLLLAHSTRTSAFDDEQDLISSLLCHPVTSLHVRGCLSDFGFFTNCLDAYVLRDMRELSLEVGNATADSDDDDDESASDEDSDDDDSDEGVVKIKENSWEYVWNNVVRDEFLRGLQSFQLRMDAIWEACFDLAMRAPCPSGLLPRLESLVIDSRHVSVPHLESILRRASLLRRLVLHIPGWSNDRGTDSALTQRILTSISQRTSLLSLELKIKIAGDSNPWVTYETSQPWGQPASQQRPPSVQHLRAEVISAIGSLLQLESLQLDFTSQFALRKLDASGPAKDIRQLRSMLPRLRVIKLCGFGEDCLQAV